MNTLTIDPRRIRRVTLWAFREGSMVALLLLSFDHAWAGNLARFAAWVTCGLAVVVAVTMTVLAHAAEEPGRDLNLDAATRQKFLDLHEPAVHGLLVYGAAIVSVAMFAAHGWFFSATAYLVHAMCVVGVREAVRRFQEALVERVP